MKRAMTMTSMEESETTPFRQKFKKPPLNILCIFDQSMMENSKIKNQNAKIKYRLSAAF